jgi:hypothetical protein
MSPKPYKNSQENNMTVDVKLDVKLMSYAAHNIGAAFADAARKVHHATHKSTDWLAQQDRKVTRYAMQLCRNAEDLGEDTAKVLRDTARRAREEWVRMVPVRWC